MSTPNPTPIPWLKIAGVLAVVGIAAVVMNIGAKYAYDLWKNGRASAGG